MNVYTTLAVVVTCFSLVAGEQSLLDALKVDIAARAVATPANSGSVLQNVHSTGKYDAKVVPVANIGSWIRDEWKSLPEALVTKFEAATFSQSTTFEVFSVTISPAQAHLVEYIGAARRTNDNSAEIAYLYVDSSGSMLPKTEAVNVHSCHSCWLLGTCCNDRTEIHARGYNVAEIQLVTATLRADAYAFLAQTISNANSQSFVPKPAAAMLQLQSLISQPLPLDPEAMVRDLINGLRKEMSTDDDMSTRVTTTVVKTIVGRGLKNFAQHAEIQQLHGVSHDYISEFQSWLSLEINLPKRYGTYVKDMVDIVSHAESNEWTMFQLLFSTGHAATCRCVVVLGRNDRSTRMFDWLIADVNAEFEFAPDLMVVRHSKSSLAGLQHSSWDEVLEVPHAINRDDLSLLFDFFNVVVLERFAEVLHLLPTDNLLEISSFTKTINSSVAPPVPAVDPVVTAVTTVIDLWPKFVAAFKSTSSTELKEKLVGVGFDYFSGHSTMDYLHELDAEYVPQYINVLMDSLEVPENKREAFAAKVNLMPHMSDGEFSVYDLTYTSGPGGDCKYVCIIMVNDRVKNTSSFMVSDIRASFHLAPDIFVIQKSKSSLGGLFSSSSIEFQYHDRPITPEDMAIVFDFFKMVAFSGFAKALDIPVTSPDLG